ncbi:MAG: hypothetical protein HYX92_04575 [Chloroflexi bacterium]|nr:hypothetical protein [Chloroflexota bacterium]
MPTVAFTRKGFTQVVGNAFAGFGFSPEGPVTYEFPTEMFLTESDLSPIEAHIDSVIDGLTKWQPKMKRQASLAAKRITVEGKDYQDAVDKMNHLFLKNMWADGLPVLPPTEERVAWILTGTDRPRNSIIGEGKILPRGGVSTVEVLAIALAMAGGRPEYLPVLIASIEAITNPLTLHQNFQPTTNSGYPVVIVNGPITKQIRLNWSYGCLGPDPRFPAGASIGRAIRLLLQNVGGAIPGIGTMAIYGGPARYTNIVFAEDEAGVPKGWEPLNEERGFPRGTNTVTTQPVASTVNVLNASAMAETAEGQLINILRVSAHNMSTLNANYFHGPNYFGGSPGVLLIPRGVAKDLAAMGWSKQKVKNFLWENSKVPDTADLRGVLSAATKSMALPAEAAQIPMPITAKPENIMIAIAGGEQSGHNYWMQIGVAGRQPTSAGMELPKNWDDLIAQAREDLGPIPEV